MKKKIKKPSFWKVLLEGRAFIELGSYYTLYPFLKQAPCGDGHPVLVLPGLLASDKSTSPLRRFLDDKGFNAYPWELGRNYGRLEFADLLEERIHELYLQHGTRVSLVGWSLGGIYARILANRLPEKVRQVITLGSPFMGARGESNADFAFEFFSGQKRGEVNEKIVELMETAPPMPFTAIYSKRDGIVSWQHCIEREVRYDIQNIEIIGSHFGLGVNPSVLLCIADRLAQEEGCWEPFEFSNGVKGLFYPQFWTGTPEPAVVYD